MRSQTALSRIPFLSIFIVLLASSLAFMGLGASATASEESPIPGDQSSLITPYVYTNSDGVLSFDFEKAEADGVSEDILELGVLFNSFSKKMAAGGSFTPCLRGWEFWGNWCGPAHSGGPVKDHLDWSCKQHDECYAARGYLRCSCDNELVANITRLLPYMSGQQARKASVIKAYFQVSVCRP